MSKLRATMAISLDGFSAGPDQSVDHALGVGGERLHGWMIPLAVFRKMHGEDGGEGEANASTAVIRGRVARRRGQRDPPVPEGTSARRDRDLADTRPPRRG
jgi:hypothetical protein